MFEQNICIICYNEIYAYHFRKQFVQVLSKLQERAGDAWISQIFGAEGIF